MHGDHRNSPYNCIFQHCGVKTSTVTPSFYYVFNISLSCDSNKPSFIRNLWWVLLHVLLWNHLKRSPRINVKDSFSPFLNREGNMELSVINIAFRLTIYIERDRSQNTALWYATVYGKWLRHFLIYANDSMCLRFY